MSWTAVQGAFSTGGLDPTAKFVLVAIGYRVGRNGAGAWPSIAVITDDTGLAERTVRYALTRLVDAKRLRVIHRSGQSSVYVPTPAPDAAVGVHLVPVTAASDDKSAASGAPRRGYNRKGTAPTATPQAAAGAKTGPGGDTLAPLIPKPLFLPGSGLIADWTTR